MPCCEERIVLQRWVVGSVPFHAAIPALAFLFVVVALTVPGHQRGNVVVLLDTVGIVTILGDRVGIERSLVKLGVVVVTRDKEA